MSIDLPKDCLPAVSEIPGIITGYYSFSRIRYKKMNNAKLPYIEYIQLGSHEDSEVWREADSIYPIESPVYLSCRSKAKFSCPPILPFGQPLIVSEKCLKVINEFKLVPEIQSFECLFTSKGKVLKSKLSYFGLYGPSSGLYTKEMPSAIFPTRMADLQNSPYAFYFVHPDQPELGEYDIFVGPQGNVSLSESLVKSLLELDKDLQFDPVLTY
tara:strand:+ start:4929 stop:5567 length:639 start_codon:yes stop_codon:yes gene_type:complete